jgi:hypothetical protein
MRPGWTGLTPRQPANSLLSCFSRSLRASDSGPLPSTRKSIALPLSTFTALPVGGQSDFPKRLGASGLEDCQVAESVCAAGVH